MAVLNPPGGLPGAAFAITRLVLHLGGTVEEARLASLLTPRTLAAQNDDGTVMNRNLQVTLQWLGSLALVDRVDGHVAVSDRLARHLDENLSRATFDAAMRRETVAVDRDGDPWDDDGATGGRDLARGLCWLMAQPALAPALMFGTADDHDADRRQTEGFRGRPSPAIHPFVNAERWNSFVRWAIALGFADESAVKPPNGRSAAIEPVPTRLLEDELVRLGPGRYGLPDLLDALAAEIPVLPDGSSYASMVRSAGGPLNDDEEQGFVAPSIGEALLTLEMMGRVELLAEADAPGRQLRAGNGSIRTVSHLVLAEVGR